METRRAACSQRPSVRPAVIDWNQVLLIVNTPGAQPANIQPTRNFAILHAAIYDAVNSIYRAYEPYLISIRAPRGASETAAADAAAHTALVGLYPAQQSSLDTDYTAELAKVADGPAKDKGIRLGQQVATDLLAIRANDGSSVVPPPFVAGTNPGDYRPTPPNLPLPVFTTWGQVTPFVLDSGDQFRPGPPPALTKHTRRRSRVESLARRPARPARPTRHRSASSGPRRSRTSGTRSPGLSRSLIQRLRTTARLFASLNLSFAAR